MAVPVCILTCSPRRGGNSDTAAAWLRTAFSLPAEVLRVADKAVHPCVSCGYCAERPGSCVLDGSEDGALSLLKSLTAAPAACLVSPIYFYHLPAQAKALIDRCQRFWNGAPPGRGTPFGAVLLAGRPQGERLFQGAELTLRFMAHTLGLKPIPPLCLYGVDAPDALAGRTELRERIRNYAAELEELAGHGRSF